MSKQDAKAQNTKSATDVDNPERRKLLGSATRLAVYTAPVLFTISHNAFGKSRRPERLHRARAPLDVDRRIKLWPDRYHRHRHRHQRANSGEHACTS